MGAGIQPGETTAKALDAQVAVLEVGIVDVGDFQLAPGGRFDRLGDLDHIVVVEVQAGHCVAGLWLLGFLFDGNRVALAVELDHAKALGVVHPVAEDGRTTGMARRALELLGEVLAVEDVVAKDQAYGILANELFANQEGLSQAVRRRLHRIAELDAKLAAVPQQLTVLRQVMGGGDHQDFADASKHQHRDRVVDHRFVIDRQQLLGHPERNGVEACTRTSGEDYPFHAEAPSRSRW
ncbi:hypothetical protein FQZ97_961970 [compost metagenome]